MANLLCLTMSLLIALSSCETQKAAMGSENTVEACRDGVDNDEDGYYDCGDQDCFQFVFCAESAAALHDAEVLTAGDGTGGDGQAEAAVDVLATDSPVFTDR